jgi:twinkle protein
LFGMDKFSSGSHKYVTITEGEYDALSLHQVIGGPVLSVQSASSAHRDCVVARDYLQGFDRIYLAFDADNPGREAAASVAKLFDYNKVYFVKFSKRKDANEYLLNDEANELRQIWWNSATYRPDNIISTLAEFSDALDHSPGQGLLLYPTKQLNDMTYGIRTSETVLITAKTGRGKTSLMHAIEYAALTQEPDLNVGAIYLEEPKGNHLKALAGIHLQRPVHLPDCGVSKSEIDRALSDIVGRDDRLHLYTHFGSDNPRILEDTIRFLVSARGCRLVILDHLTMVVAGLQGEDQRLALDYLSTRLTMMCVELDFAFIVASHVNDNMQTRGSRLIEGNAHIHIQLERDPNDPATQTTTEFFIPKNRPISKTGPAGSATFDTYTRQYIDPANDNFPVEEVGDAAA